MSSEPLTTLYSSQAGLDVFQSLTGEHISSVLECRASPRHSSSDSLEEHSATSYCTLMFSVFWQQLSTWDDENVSAGGYIWLPETLLEDCSVKCPSWSLNSRCQHQFTKPVEETVVEANAMRAGENIKLGWRYGGEFRKEKKEWTKGGGEETNNEWGSLVDCR